MKNTAILKKPFKKSNFILAPGESTNWQNHADYEVLIVFEGSGVLYSEENNHKGRIIQAQDIVFLPAFKSHRILNTTQKPLRLGNIWWLPQPDYINTQKANSNEVVNLILPSFTTPNGRMHLGHLAGPVVAADIYKRAQQILGKTAYQLCGTIGYQTQVSVSAKKLNLSYIDTALKYSEDFLDNYELMDINYDTFATLKEAKLFEKITDDYINALEKSGYLSKQSKAIPFCNNGHNYLFEAHVSATCPHCGAKVSGECENCAIFIADETLIQPECKLCAKSVKTKKLDRIYIDLEPHRHIVENLLINGAYRGNTAQFVQKILNNPLPEIPLGIYSDVGISLKIDGFTDQKVYSAVELVSRFITAVELSGKNQNQTFDLTLFFGSDNNYLRCIIFPILLNLYKPNKFRINGFFSNEFYELNGEKFSTSRNHVLYAQDVVNNGINPDWLRLYLAATYPSQTRRNFVLNSAIGWINLKQARINKVLERITLAITKRHEGKIPEAASWDNTHKEFYEQLLNFKTEAIRLYQVERFDINKLVELIAYMLNSLNTFSQQIDNNSYDSRLDRTTIAITAIGIELFSSIIYPFMPNISRDLQKTINIQAGNYIKLADTLSLTESSSKFKPVNNKPTVSHSFVQGI